MAPKPASHMCWALGGVVFWEGDGMDFLRVVSLDLVMVYFLIKLSL
jgi:hypothetical protein